MKKPYSYLNPKAEIRKSPITGQGGFAKTLIKKGELVAIWGGHVISNEQYLKLSKEIQEEGHSGYPLEIHGNFCLGPITIKEVDGALFLNHSCNPNIGIKGQIVFVAMRDIKPGEELTYDYATVDSDETILMNFQCNCGSPNCRKIITSNDWRDPGFQKKYKGYLSWWIQERIKKESK